MSGCENGCRRVTHCIFDMDGTLLDTEKLYTRTTEAILEQYGKKLTWEFKVTIMGLQTPEASEKIVQQYSLPMTGEEYARIQKEMNQKIMSEAQLMPGAQRLLCHLHSHDVPIALATSCAEDMFRIKSTNHRQLFDLFHHRVFGSSDRAVKNGKPAPDIFLVAAQRFDTPANPACCLVFEDAPNGVKGAVRAGMQVVMIPDPRLPEELTKEATQVICSLEDFCPQNFGLPAFD